MIELLILYLLNKFQLTMYGVQKKISEDFAIYTKPGFGTIKPALVRLENKGFLMSRRSISEGGRLAAYYTITPQGIEELRRLIVSRTSDNPVKFLNTARVKLICSALLSPDEQVKLIDNLKLKAETIYNKTKNSIEKSDFYYKIVTDNQLQEYKNFISLLEGMRNGCTG